MKCRIMVDSYRCNSCGGCAEVCPEIFIINEVTDKAECLKDEAECSDELLHAAALCPTDCIEIEEVG